MAHEWLKPICSAWLSAIKKAQDHKRKDFQNDADEAMRFFDGPYDFIYDTAREDDDEPGERWARPGFEMTYNKVAEMVQLFGPALYHRNPHRQVNPAQRPQLPLSGDPNDPQMQLLAQQLQAQRLAMGNRIDTLAKCLEAYLNYTPNELGLRDQFRQVVDEALIKGMGVLWTTTVNPPGSQLTLVGSFYDSVDNLVIDPDMESIEHAKWIARRRVFPVWEVEDRWQLPRGTLRGNLESRNSQSQAEAEPEDYYYDQARGDTNDLYTYWEVYSRMGMGHRLRAAHGENMRALSPILDQFGQHCFLVVSDDYACPLNVPDYAVERESLDGLFDRVQWPIPFWADHADPWPFTYIAFHKRPRKLWPMSHVKPAMGELKFLNWAFSFIASKIKNTSRDFIAISKGVGEEMKNTILGGRDLELIEIESAHGTIAQVVSFLQHPQFNGDVYKVIDVMMSLLERRLGLNELMYGESARQLRSASEAQIKGDQMRIRPDDMAECVETGSTKVARKEGLAIRWTIDARSAAPIVGPELAMAWPAVVENSDPQEVVLELAYRIEAGSIRKPNRNRDQENASGILRDVAPLLQDYYKATGDAGPINAFLEMVCKAFDLPAEKFMLKPPPPPQPDPMVVAEHQMEMQVEQMKAQIEMQKAMLDSQLKQAELRAKLAADARKAQNDLALAAAEGQQGMAMSAAEHRQEMVQDAQVHEQELEQSRQSFLLELLQQRQLGEAKVAMAKKQAAAKPKPTSKAA